MMVAEDQLIKFNPSKNLHTTITRFSPSSQPIDMRVIPGKKQAKGAEIIAIACADGKLMLLKGSKIDRALEAHAGAMLVLRWSGDGQVLATGGEDGLLKLWSPAGMLRSTLHQSQHPVYCLSFSPCNSKVLFCSHKSLCIKPLQPNSIDSNWKAHDGVVLCVDWNCTNNAIISAGEDCKYKVWDAYGRQLYSSSALNFPATSVAWSPDGSLFVVATFHNVRLCHHTGWAHDIQRCVRGSLYGVTWSDDGTRVAAGCGGGGVLLASVLQRTLESWPFKVQQATENSLSVTNLSNDAVDLVDVRERISLLSLQHSHLVLSTPLTCYVYSTNNWNVPVEFSIKDKNVTLLRQSSKFLLLLDASASSVHVFTYAGKLTSSIRHPSMHPFNSRLIAMNDEVVVMRSGQDVRSVLVWNLLSGKSQQTLQHEEVIEEVGVDQMTSSLEKRLSLVDSKQHLYLVSISSNQPGVIVKTGLVVEQALWNESASLLLCASDATCHVLTCPAALFSDRSLFNLCALPVHPVRDSKGLRGSSFQGSRVCLSSSDGSLLQTTVPAQVLQVHSLVNKQQWKQALMLCRLVDKEHLWACLAALALSHKQLEATEACYVALDQPDKVRYVRDAGRRALKEVRESDLLMLMNKRQASEAVLLHHNNLLAAIILNIDNFNWPRALELAQKHSKHIDIVVGHRQQYLRALAGRKETLQCFKPYAEMEVDWEAIKAKMKAEYEK